MRKDKDPDGGTRRERPVQQKAEATKRIEELEVGEHGFVPLIDEIRNLERTYAALRVQRATLEEAFAQEKPGGWLGPLKTMFDSRHRELTSVNEEIVSVVQKIRTKSTRVYQGMIDVMNVVTLFIAERDPEYRVAEVIKTSLGTLKSVARPYLDSVEHAQVKVREARQHAEAGEVIVGTDPSAVPDEFKETAESLQAVTLNAATFGRAISAYASNVKGSRQWHVTVAVDRESTLRVNVLTHVHFVDIYTPHTLDDLQVQLADLHKALNEIMAEINQNDKTLTEEKDEYELEKLKELCKPRNLYFFTEKDRTHYKERAKHNWSRDKSQDAEEGSVNE